MSAVGFHRAAGSVEFYASPWVKLSLDIFSEVQNQEKPNVVKVFLNLWFTFSILLQNPSLPQS